MNHALGSRGDDRAAYAEHRRWALIAAYVTYAFVQFAGLSGHAVLELVSQLALMSAFLQWWTLDASLHRKTIHHGVVLPFLATLPVSMAFYLAWTRGWRRGLTAYAKAAAVGVLVFAAVVASRLLATGGRL